LTNKIKLFDKQKQFFFCREREALLEAGISYGKSRVASIWLATMCQYHSRSKWFMAARDYKQLKTAIDQEFEFYLHDILGLERGVHYRKTSGSPIIYEWNNGTIIYGVGAHNYDTVFRAGNYSGAWGDEVDFWKPDAVKALRGRIRVYPEKLRFTSSPKGYNHVWEDFYQNKTGIVYNAPTTENVTLSKEFVESLRRSYSPQLFEQEVMAKRLNLTVGKVYSEFLREAHIRECRDVYTGEEDLYFFTDYNISHYCGTYMLKKGDVIYAIGEEHLEYKGSREMAKIVKSKHPNAIVVGDSTGNNKRDVAIDVTNYKHFQEAGLMTKHFINPPVQARIISANSNLHHRKVVIDPSCKTLIKDLELVSWKEDGSDIDKSNLELSHASDGWSYGMWHLAPVGNKKPKAVQVR
jgi:hypothetical protein